jgi:hypothetical protein
MLHANHGRFNIGVKMATQKNRRVEWSHGPLHYGYDQQHWLIQA